MNPTRETHDKPMHPFKLPFQVVGPPVAPNKLLHGPYLRQGSTKPAWPYLASPAMKQNRTTSGAKRMALQVQNDVPFVDFAKIIKTGGGAERFSEPSAASIPEWSRVCVTEPNEASNSPPEGSPSESLKLSPSERILKVCVFFFF